MLASSSRKLESYPCLDGNPLFESTYPENALEAHVRVEGSVGDLDNTLELAETVRYVARITRCRYWSEVVPCVLLLVIIGCLVVFEAFLSALVALFVFCLIFVMT